jgi:pimeloyl-ACP methyl ester carboxylesterase
MDIERGLVKTRYGYIHYRAAGSGSTPVFLFHINQQSSALMLELLSVIGTARRVIAIDYPSHGHSDHVAKQPRIDDYAYCAIELMDQRGIGKACVMGEAVGAATSIAFSVNHPDRVERMIMVNCPYYEGARDADEAHTPLKTGLRPADPSGFPMTRTLEFVLQNDPLHMPLHPTQSWMDRVNTAQMEAGRDRWQALDALHAFEIAGNLANIPCPAMNIWGEHFIYTPHRQDFASRVKDHRDLVIPNGRFGMTWEHAETIGREALKFFD